MLEKEEEKHRKILPTLRHFRPFDMQAIASDHGNSIHNERGERAVNNQAAVLIDCENIAITYADSLRCFLLTDVLQHHACVDVLDLFGKDSILRLWQMMDLAYPLQCHTNQEGKNAASSRMGMGTRTCCPK